MWNSTTILHFQSTLPVISLDSQTTSETSEITNLEGSLGQVRNV